MLPAVAPSDTFGDAETQPDETENLAPHRAPETQWYSDAFYENFYAEEYERQRRRANRDRHLASRPWPLGGRVLDDFQRFFALSVLLSRAPTFASLTCSLWERAAPKDLGSSANRCLRSGGAFEIYASIARREIGTCEASMHYRKKPTGSRWNSRIWA